MPKKAVAKKTKAKPRAKLTRMARYQIKRGEKQFCGHKQTRRKDEVNTITDKEHSLIRAYLQSGSIKKASAETGFTERKAKDTLIKVPVVNEIEKQTNDLLQKGNINLARILGELQNIAFGSVIDIMSYDEKTEMLKLDPDKINAKSARLIKGVEIVEKETKFGVERTLKISYHDKMRALERLIDFTKFYVAFANNPDAQGINLALLGYDNAEGTSFFSQLMSPYSSNNHGAVNPSGINSKVQAERLVTEIKKIAGVLSSKKKTDGKKIIEAKFVEQK